MWVDRSLESERGEVGLRRTRLASVGMAIAIAALMAMLVSAASAVAFSAPTYSSSFGSYGTGNGQFKEPRGITVDPSGNVWVSDINLNRIQKFNSKGEYVCQVGASGSGNGQFKKPRGLAADASGNVWIADEGNNRLQKISSSCGYLSQLGSYGSGNGQMIHPYGVAIDPSGNIWVADYENTRIDEFNSKGEFVAKCGTEGSGNGQFEEGPVSIATDADGNVWVGDGNPRVEQFSSKCKYLAKFDKTSSGAPYFTRADGIAIDSAGNLWMPNGIPHGYSSFYPEGEYVGQFGKAGTGNGEFSVPQQIAIGPDGSLWAIDSFNTTARVQKWLPGTPSPVETGRAAQLKRTEATLKATINPQGKATSYQFQYGTTTSFGTSVPATPKSIGSGSSPVAVSEYLDGLKAETTYYYRVVATGAGTTYGQTRHFTTLAAAKAGSQVLIGGKTFSELGIKEKTVYVAGTFRIEMGGVMPTFQCGEKGTGTLVSTGLSKESVTLNCVVVWYEKRCTVKPFSFNVNGSFAVINTEESGTGEGCPIDETITLSASPSGSFQYGSASTSLNVTALATTKWGSNTVTMTGNSHWTTLIGEELAYDTP
jgi:streptogramin lyase